MIFGKEIKELKKERDKLKSEIRGLWELVAMKEEALASARAMLRRAEERAKKLEEEVKTLNSSLDATVDELGAIKSALKLSEAERKKLLNKGRARR